SEVLPGPERPVAELQATLDRFGPRFDVEAAIYSPDRTLVAWVGSPLPLPEGSGFRGHWTRLRGHVLFAVQLPDRRPLGAARHPGLRHGVGLVATLALLALAVGLGAWPLGGRLTRRLERLRARVEDLGRGDLRARAPVEGTDEVADLARSFNRAAERIQGLVEAQRRQLAFASHELRSPLARLRVALEMMSGEPSVRQGAERDVAELDALIGELLEARPLGAGGAGDSETIDLLRLVAEEAARPEAPAS